MDKGGKTLSERVREREPEVGERVLESEGERGFSAQQRSFFFIPENEDDLSSGTLRRRRRKKKEKK